VVSVFTCRYYPYNSFLQYKYNDYKIALIVARMDSLKNRREMLMERLLKKQVLASKSLTPLTIT